MADVLPEAPGPSGTRGHRRRMCTVAYPTPAAGFRYLLLGKEGRKGGMEGRKGGRSAGRKGRKKGREGRREDGTGNSGEADSGDGLRGQAAWRLSQYTEWSAHVAEVAQQTGLSGQTGLFEVAARTYRRKDGTSLSLAVEQALQQMESEGWCVLCLPISPPYPHPPALAPPHLPAFHAAPLCPRLRFCFPPALLPCKNVFRLV